MKYSNISRMFINKIICDGSILFPILMAASKSALTFGYDNLM